jgi:uncharacterized protein (TIGR02145 family)
MKTLIRLFLALCVLSVLINGCKKIDDTITGTVKDYDGNVYHTVKIGDQTWMVENLKTKHYNDGVEINYVDNNATWGTLTIPAYCWYDNNEDGYKDYGALYNWYAASSSKLCPAGWHVPSQSEWETLVTYLGGYDLAGGKLKESGTAHWVSPNTSADNSSGFTGLPSGSHYTNGSFYYLGKFGWIWSITESSATEAWHIYMQYNTGAIVGKAGTKADGFAVRCIKD